MPMPKPVCRTNSFNKIVQLDVCRTFSGRGMGINGTAQFTDGIICSLVVVVVVVVISRVSRISISISITTTAFADGIGTPDPDPKHECMQKNEI